jgi:hypothetical protein
MFSSCPLGCHCQNLESSLASVVLLGTGNAKSLSVKSSNCGLDFFWLLVGIRDLVMSEFFL